DLARYELHRCWVVEANLKEGTRHIYAKRRFYIDEDSWQIMVADQYDGRGELWRVSEGHSINYYDALTMWTTLELHMDLFSGRYNAGGLDNEMKMYEFNPDISVDEFTPQELRREGVR
ncbi:MAG: outer membrane lipoprotein-sorting protein, partial [Verrucomicrobiae bacterium]|nr:outer membrane lipoprotein-sorting protein [Verrucomicrobiae bacterium]